MAPNSNFPQDSEGRVHHLSVKAGEVSNRIITAGDPARVRRFAQFLDPLPRHFEVLSARGFLTITGRYKGVPVSLCAIGMGYPNIDFMVREARAVVEGDMAIIRFGSCGSLDPTFPTGSIGVVSNAMTIQTQYDHWDESGASLPPYVFSKPIPSDPVLHDLLLKTLQPVDSSVRNIELHASADCFYSAQGRTDPNFDDDNSELVNQLVKEYPTLSSFEMETAHLYHLARISHAKGKISVAAAHMVFAARVGDEDKQVFIDSEVVERLEPKIGRLCLDALVAFEIEGEKLHPTSDSVWEMK